MGPDVPFFAPSLPSDGLMDMINISATCKRTTGIRMLLSVDNGKLIDFPEVIYRKVHAYRITPRVYKPTAQRKLMSKFGKWLGGGGKQKEGLIAVDGESVPFEPFQAEVVPKLATVLSKRYGLYEYDGPRRSFP